MYWNILRWAKDVSFNPKKLTKKDYKYEDFIKRLIIVSLVPGAITTAIALATFGLVAQVEGSTAAMISVAIGIPIFVLSALVGPFVNAAVIHFFGKFVFRLMNKDFKKTYNAVAYSMLPRFLTIWIPIVGGLIALVWGLIVGVYALSNQQKISTKRALVVILIPIIIVVVVALIFAAAVAGFVAGSILV